MGFTSIYLKTMYFVYLLFDLVKVDDDKNMNWILLPNFGDNVRKYNNIYVITYIPSRIIICPKL